MVRSVYIRFLQKNLGSKSSFSTSEKQSMKFLAYLALVFNLNALFSFKERISLLYLKSSLTNSLARNDIFSFFIKSYLDKAFSTLNFNCFSNLIISFGAVGIAI